MLSSLEQVNKLYFPLLVFQKKKKKLKKPFLPQIIFQEIIIHHIKDKIGNLI